MRRKRQRVGAEGVDVFGIPRSEWDPKTLLEQPSDGERTMRRFEEANALYARGG